MKLKCFCFSFAIIVLMMLNFSILFMLLVILLGAIRPFLKIFAIDCRILVCYNEISNNNF